MQQRPSTAELNGSQAGDLVSATAHDACPTLTGIRAVDPTLKVVLTADIIKIGKVATELQQI